MTAEGRRERESTATRSHQPLGTEAQGSQLVAKKGKNGAKRQKSKSVSKPLSHKRPSQQLRTQRSLETTTDRRHSYDSHATNDRSHDSHMTRSSMPRKEQLPKMFSFSSGMFMYFYVPLSPSPHLPCLSLLHSPPLPFSTSPFLPLSISSLLTSPPLHLHLSTSAAPSPKPVAKSSYHHDNKLPSINLKNMKAVAVVAVDTQADNLRVRGFGETSHPNHGNMSPMSRSRSLMAVRYIYCTI